MIKAYEDRVLSEYVILNVQQMGGTGPAIAMAEVMRHNAAFEPKRMLDYMHRIHNVHGKFYEMDSTGTETSVPLPEIIKEYVDAGYSNVISSEYEGFHWNTWDDPFDQIAAQPGLPNDAADALPTPARLAASANARLVPAIHRVYLLINICLSPFTFVGYLYSSGSRRSLSSPLGFDLSASFCGTSAV